jgi:hypothetical protein
MALSEKMKLSLCEGISCEGWASAASSSLAGRTETPEKGSHRNSGLYTNFRRVHPQNVHLQNARFQNVQLENVRFQNVQFNQFY